MDVAVSIKLYKIRWQATVGLQGVVCRPLI